jgi:hypothetical protein
MDLNPEQASIALNDITQAQRKLAVFTGYQRGAPHLWLWGVIWLVGYSATDLQPRYAGETWLTLNLIGFLTGAWLARATAAPAGGTGDRARSPWDLPARQVLYVGLAFALFIAATFVLFTPTPTQFGAFPALLVGFAYTVVGIWGGVRWLAAGISLSVLTMVGYLYVPQHFMLWMAVFGGGTLIASGFWMKAR